MTKITLDRAVVQQALEALEGVVEYDYHGNPLTETDAACNDAINAFLSALAEPVQEHDLSRCPKCGGPADNGHDREVPPNPYYCTKCMAEPVAWRWGYRSVTTGEMDWRGYVEIPAHPNLRSPAIIMEPLYTAPPQRPAEPVQDSEWEVRADGKRVRKDRWQIGIRCIVALLWGNRQEFEVDEVVEAVRHLVPNPYAEGDDEALVRAVLEQPERDWEDLYRKEKARADMWRDKYESLAGPDERVYPQQEQEPIAFVPVHPRNGSLWSMTTNEPSQERLPSYPLMPLYTHPPSREWQGLTDKDLGKLHGALEEREACAKVCEENAVMIGVLCAAAIRARGQA